MSYENILLEAQNGIWTVTLNRPKALNALNRALLSELSQVMERAAEAPSLKGILLQGGGEKAFVAGADISEFIGLDRQAAYDLAKNGQDLFARIEAFPKPVVAVVQGFALGGGCELAMACHLRIATERARFGQPEVNLGIIPGYGGTQRLVQYVGKTKALELLMTADMIDAAEALRLGLVNYVLPDPEQARAKAVEIIDKIAGKAPVAIAKVIECVNACFEDGTDGFAKELDEFANSANTEDFREGASAFLEKRKANFQGR